MDKLKNRPSELTIGDSWLEKIWVLIQKGDPHFTLTIGSQEDHSQPIKSNEDIVSL
jgi:hypothetical protein